MAQFSWFNISVAGKCRLLFALAVVIIIAAALVVPLKWMDVRVHEMNTRQARRMALVAANRSGLPAGDWQAKEQALQQWWSARAAIEELQGPAPRLIRLGPGGLDSPERLDPIVAEAVARLQAEPELKGASRWGRDATGLLRYHYVLPVRSPDGVLQGVVYAMLPASPETIRDLWWNRAVVVAAALLAGILAVVVFYLITHKLILSPVRQLRDLAQQVAAGDLTVRSQLRTGDEFEQLAEAFNEMLASLNRSHQELRQINVSLDTRLGELAQTNVALFEANKLKSEFLANVSHELRTPLTSIIGFAELLQRHGSAGDGKAARYLQHILTSGRMLLEMINDLLDLAKIEAGKVELHIAKVNLPDICQNLVDFLRPLADKKDLQLRLDVTDRIPLIDSDAGKVQQVLYNLLSNAVKFTPAGGSVTITAGIGDRDHVRVSVADTGPGIPLDQQATIFEKFRQAEPTVTRQHGGSGLGLAISKELTVMLGGSISVSSTPGAGATFTVTLPLTAPKTVQRPLVRLT